MATTEDDDPDRRERAPKSRADQVRAAVEQAFGATAHGAAPMRERAQELADELIGAASRVRDVIDELRAPSAGDEPSLAERLAALERRVEELEATAARPPRARPAVKPRTTPPRKPTPPDAP